MTIYTSTARAASRVENAVQLPPDFDPATNPILATHWYGVEPLRLSGEVTAEMLANLRRQRQAAHLHSLGPRPGLEALIEVADGGDLDTVLADYERLDLEVVMELGGDKFPPNIFAVGST